MAGKLSPSAQQRIAQFESFTSEVGRINSLIEQFAVARVGQDSIRASLKRAASQSKLKFMTQGFAQLSQICGTIELTAARSGPPAAMARALREHIGALKFQIELEMRTIVREDEEAQAAKKKLKQEETT
ncbi:MAG TPA: hypothetical protein VF021_09985 [Longimicrobiales bacterium]